MKIVHIADLHIGKNNLPIKDENYFDFPIPIRIADTFRKIKIVFEYAMKLRKSGETVHVVVAGDIFDQPNIKMLYKEEFARLVSNIAKEIPVLILVGNHDSDGNKHAFSDVIHYQKGAGSKIYVVDKPKTIGIDHNSYCCVPYLGNVPDKAYVDCIKNFKEISSIHMKVLVGHFGVEGAILSKDHTSRNKIPSSILNDFSYAALGDYHTPQKIRGTKRAYYSGSIQRLRMTDQEKRSFNVFDSTTNKTTIVELKDRQYLDVAITYRMLLQLEKDAKAKEVCCIAGVPIENGSIVKLKISCTRTQKSEYKTKILPLRDSLRKNIGVAHIFFTWICDEDVKVRDEEEHKSPMEIFREYSAINVPPKGTINMFKKLLVEASNDNI